MSERSGFGAGQLIAGAVLLGLGSLLLLREIGVIGPINLGDLWPIIPMAIGITRLIGAEQPEARRGGWILFFLACWFFVNTLGLFGLDWGSSWPLVLVAVGLGKLLAAGGGLESGQALFLIATGVVLQGLVLGFFGLDLDEAWPLLLVAAGIWIMLRAFDGGRRRTARKETDDETS